MTKGEWLARQTNPKGILTYLRTRKPSPRKLRLFAAACCRRVWPLLTPKKRAQAEAAERFADGEIDKGELAVAHRSSPSGWRNPAHYATSERCAVDSAADSSKRTAGAAAWYALERRGVSEVASLAQARDAAWAVERKAQCEILRDLFAHLLIGVTISPGCVTTAVSSIAQAVYDERVLPSGPPRPGPPRRAVGRPGGRRLHRASGPRPPAIAGAALSRVLGGRPGAGQGVTP